MEHTGLRDTAFGAELSEMLEERDIKVTPHRVGLLAEEAGLDGWALINRMANDRAEFKDPGGALARKLNLTLDEQFRLVIAFEQG